MLHEVGRGQLFTCDVALTAPLIENVNVMLSIVKRSAGPYYDQSFINQYLFVLEPRKHLQFYICVV